ncbi:hypothetical protein JOM56_001532 [Amanita muscaria]
MSIRPAIVMDGTSPLRMYKTPSSSPEEKARWLTIHGLVPLSHDADGNWRKSTKAKILVLNGLGRGLATFKSTKELLCVFADATDAHQQALDKANILHRDVNPGSFLITDEGRGVLVDWDVYNRDKRKYFYDRTKDVLRRRPTRTGTFQCFPARYVVNRIFEFGPHSRLDDMESLFHALQWIVLRFVHHGMHPITLGTKLDRTFDAAYLGKWGFMICLGRLESLGRSIWGTCKNFEGVLPDLLENLRESIDSRYTSTLEMEKAQIAYQDYQNERKLGPASRDTTLAAKRAILLKQLEDTDWFRNRLRQAAEDPLCPTNDTSTPQACVHPCKRQA